MIGTFGIAAEQEVGVQRMRWPRRYVLDGPASRDQCLTDDLPAKHPLPARLRRPAAKQIHLELLEIENERTSWMAADMGRVPFGDRKNSRRGPR